MSSEEDYPKTDEVPGRLEDVVCAPCLRQNIKNDGRVYCADCKEYRFESCAKEPHLIHDTKMQPGVDLQDKGQSKPLYDRCKQHAENKLDFCVDENNPCCSICALSDHKECHSVVDISTIAGQKIPDWTSMKKDMTDIITKAQKIIQHINNQRDALKAGTADIQNKIQKTQEMFDKLKKTAATDKDKTFVDFDERDMCLFTSMIADTEQIFSDINAEIESFKGKTFVDFDEKDNRCRIMITDTEQIFSDINEVSQQGTAVHQMIVGCLVADMLSELEKFLEERKEVRMSLVLKLSPVLDLNYGPCK